MVQVNCDMGEAFGLYKMGDDEAIMPLIDVANVACGFHASDPTVMRRTVRLAKQHGVAVGAHPSLPDLQGFGRREMTIPRDEL
ncbi:MAG: LamB/YcsF family protein, partial [Geminicoccaceae bacterium]